MTKKIDHLNEKLVTAIRAVNEEKKNSALEKMAEFEKIKAREVPMPKTFNSFAELRQFREAHGK